jgi:hypothetical protein
MCVVFRFKRESVFPHKSASNKRSARILNRTRESTTTPMNNNTTTVDDAFVVRALETDGTRARGAPPSSSPSFFLYLPVVARRRASSRWCFGI